MLRGVRLHHGHYYLAKSKRCPRCEATLETFDEKIPDVNIAVELLRGAQGDAFDTATLVSWDSDLTRPVRAVQARYPGKRVVDALFDHSLSTQSAPGLDGREEPGDVDALSALTTGPFISAGVVRDYLLDNLQFGMTEDEHAALERYCAVGMEVGIVPDTPGLRSFGS